MVEQIMIRKLLKGFVVFFNPKSTAAVYKNPYCLGTNILARILNFYLKLEDLVWPLHRVGCNICGWRGRKFGYAASISVNSFSRNEVCLKCRSNERTRAIISLLANYVDLNREKLIVADIGSPNSTRHYFEHYPNLEYLTIDKFKRADVNSDICDIDLPSNFVDIVICCHVLEHVEDYRKAISELFRILKPGHYGFIAVPQAIDLKTSRRTALTTFYGYGHIWEFGDDFSDKLADEGFQISTLYEFTKGPRLNSNRNLLHIALKPGNPN